MRRYDAAVVGAGPAGMMAALKLASKGRSVLLLDRRSRPGGLCGTFELDGFRFTIGCNDFGARIAGDLHEVGVRVEFTRSTSLIDFDDSLIALPPKLGTMLHMLWRAPSILELVRRVRRGGATPLEALYSEEERAGFGFRLVSLLGYALGTPPQALRADHLRAEFSKELGYGHDRPLVPVLGAQAITDAMIMRLRELGGELALGVRVDSIERGAGGFLLHTNDGTRTARTVLRTLREPARGRAGLKVAQLLFAVPRSFPFVNARTLIVSPERADRWIAELDQGNWPARWGFHVFRDCEVDDNLTLTGFLLAPRDCDHFDPDTRRRVLGEVEGRLSRHCTGFSDVVLYRRLLDPHEYETLHGLSASLSHEIPVAHTEPLPIACEHAGLFRIGNAVAPPGDHANAAMLSGMWAAEHADRELCAR
jgi:phytoene dehydrogenase-like protein